MVVVGVGGGTVAVGVGVGCVGIIVAVGVGGGAVAVGVGAGCVGATVFVGATVWVGNGSGTVGLGVGSGGSVGGSAGAEVQAARSAKVTMTRMVDFMDRFKAIRSGWLSLFLALKQRINFDFNKPFRFDKATHLVKECGKSLHEHYKLYSITSDMSKR